MSLKNIKSNSQGFTIVELLIVVVVIAILAAITIVSYNGITNRANASAAQSSAASVQKKAEAYNAENSQYPAQFNYLTTAPNASSSDTWYLTGVSDAAPLSSTTGKNTVIYTPCGVASSGTTAPSNHAGIGIFTGATIQYFAFSGTSTNTINVGQVGSTYNVGGQARNVACFRP